MNKVFFAVALVGTLFYASNALAQNGEKIIIDDKNSESKTSIVIENGEVFVDGKKVADTDSKGRIEIIKKSTENGNARNQGFEDFRMMFPQAGKGAMLGVRTKKPEMGDGAQVIEVIGRSAADQGGLKEEDIITHIDEQKVQDPQDLVEIISALDADDEVLVRVEREGKVIDKSIILGENENAMGMNRGGTESFPFGDIFKNFGDFDIQGMMPNMNQGPKLGITIEDTENDEGVMIVDVDPNSTASASGFQENDIVVQFGKSEIRNSEDLQKAYSQSGNNETQVIVSRNGRDKVLNIKSSRAKKRSRL